VFAQELAQPFPTDPHLLGAVVAGQVSGKFAQAPAGEGLVEFLWSCGGRRDDEDFVLRTDQAGTATRPLRVQTGQARPISLNRWIICRIASSSPWTRRAMAGTVFPLAEAMITIARRSRIDEPVPRRTIFCSR
jgi:hypothetical protein